MHSHIHTQSSPTFAFGIHTYLIYKHSIEFSNIGIQTSNMDVCQLPYKIYLANGRHDLHFLCIINYQAHTSLNFSLQTYRLKTTATTRHVL